MLAKFGMTHVSFLPCVAAVISLLRKHRLQFGKAHFLLIWKQPILIILPRGDSPGPVCRFTIDLDSEGHRPGTIEKKCVGAMPLQHHLSPIFTNGARAIALFSATKSLILSFSIKKQGLRKPFSPATPVNSVWIKDVNSTSLFVRAFLLLLAVSCCQKPIANSQ